MLKHLADHADDSIVYRAVPFMAVMECFGIIRSYYGGCLAALWGMARYSFHLWAHDCWTRALCWFSDRMGWTKVYDIPETQEFRAYKMRHGRKCSGSPNCQNMDCIEESWPRWFRWLNEIGM